MISDITITDGDSTATPVVANTNNGVLSYNVNNLDVELLIDVSKIVSTTVAGVGGGVATTVLHAMDGLDVASIVSIVILSETDNSFMKYNDEAVRTTDDNDDAIINPKITITGLTYPMKHDLRTTIRMRKTDGTIQPFVFTQEVTLLGSMDTPVIAAITNSGKVVTLEIEPSSFGDYNSLLLGDLSEVWVSYAGALTPTKFSYVTGVNKYAVTVPTNDVEYSFVSYMINKSGESSDRSDVVKYLVSDRMAAPTVALDSYISDNSTAGFKIVSADVSDATTGTQDAISMARPLFLVFAHALVGPDVIDQTTSAPKENEYTYTRFPYKYNDLTGKSSIDNTTVTSGGAVDETNVFEIPDTIGSTVYYKHAFENGYGVGSFGSVSKLEVPADSIAPAVKSVSVKLRTDGKYDVEVTPDVAKDGLTVIGHNIKFEFLKKNGDVDSTLAPKVTWVHSGVAHSFDDDEIKLSGIESALHKANSSNKIPILTHHKSHKLIASESSAASPQFKLSAQTIYARNRDIVTSHIDNKPSDQKFTAKDIKMDASKHAYLADNKILDAGKIVTGEWTSSEPLNKKVVSSIAPASPTTDESVQMQGGTTVSGKVSNNAAVYRTLTYGTITDSNAVAMTAAVGATFYAFAQAWDAEIKLFLENERDGTRTYFEADEINGSPLTAIVELKERVLNEHSVKAEAVSKAGVVLAELTPTKLGTRVISGAKRILKGKYTTSTEIVTSPSALAMSAAKTTGIRAYFAFEESGKPSVDLDMLHDDAFNSINWRISEFKRLDSENPYSSEGDLINVTTGGGKDFSTPVFTSYTDPVTKQKYVTLLLESIEPQLGLQRFQFKLHREYYTNVGKTAQTTDYKPELLQFISTPYLAAPVVSLSGSENEIMGKFANPSLLDLDAKVMARIETYAGGLKNSISYYKGGQHIELKSSSDQVVRAAIAGENRADVSTQRKFIFVNPIPQDDLELIDPDVKESSRTALTSLNVDASPNVPEFTVEPYWNGTEYGYNLSHVALGAGEALTLSAHYNDREATNRDINGKPTPTFALNSTTGRFEAFLKNSDLITALSGLAEKDHRKNGVEFIAHAQANYVVAGATRYRTSAPKSVSVKPLFKSELAKSDLAVTPFLNGFTVKSASPDGHNYLQLGGNDNLLGQLLITKYDNSTTASTPKQTHGGNHFTFASAVQTHNHTNIGQGLFKIEFIIPEQKGKHEEHIIELGFFEPQASSAAAKSLSLTGSDLGMAVTITDDNVSSSAPLKSQRIIASYIDKSGNRKYFKSLSQRLAEALATKNSTAAAVTAATTFKNAKITAQTGALTTKNSADGALVTANTAVTTTASAVITKLATLNGANLAVTNAGVNVTVAQTNAATAALTAYNDAVTTAADAVTTAASAAKTASDAATNLTTATAAVTAATTAEATALAAAATAATAYNAEDALVSPLMSTVTTTLAAAIASPLDSAAAIALEAAKKAAQAEVLKTASSTEMTFLAGTASSLFPETASGSGKRIVDLHHFPVGEEILVALEAVFDPLTANVDNITKTMSTTSTIAFAPEISSLKYDADNSIVDVIVKLNGEPLLTFVLMASYEGDNVGESFVNIPVSNIDILANDTVLYRVTIQGAKPSGVMAIVQNSKGMDIKVSPVGAFGISNTAAATYDKNTMKRTNATIEL